MELSIFDREQKSRLESRYAVILLILIFLGAVVLTPIGNLVNSDISFRETVLPLLIDFFSILVSYLFFWVSFATVLYVIYRYRLSACRTVLVYYVGAVVIRYLANLLAGCIVLGWEGIGDEIPYLLINILMDSLQMALVLLIAYRLLERPRRFLRRGNENPDFLPYRGIMDWKENRLLRAAAYSVLIPFVIQLGSRVIYDISLGAAQSSVDLIWQIIAYASDVVYLFVGYLLLILFINSYYLKDSTAYARYRDASVLEDEENT